MEERYFGQNANKLLSTTNKCMSENHTMLSGKSMGIQRKQKPERQTISTNITFQVDNAANKTSGRMERAKINREAPAPRDR